ncbi:hypothetical protein AKJ09_03927 [Labilithrix luteola]|uniref:CAAX prenyl protease 2/Lysostaphin resistance protein A-like domain-containing protein n=1 Tax=Labilithrix luteola TaxID=1391654 RepID=A0A0K1PUQ8_9BACT|nr:hypothetical protein AKJ09_03927 [Labilithrix luteola]
MPVALERDASLRDTFAAALAIPSLRAWNRVRWLVALVAAIPLVLLLELDRELVLKHAIGSGRALVDVLLASYVVFELTRRTPRFPGVAAAALVAVGMRWLLVVGRLCWRGVHWTVWLGLGCALIATTAILAFAPSRERTALELLGKLGISRSEAYAVTRPSEPPPRLLGGAIIAASLLPLFLYALRHAGAGLFVQSIGLLAYGVIVPIFVRRSSGEAPEREGKLAPAKTLFAVALGLVFTAAMLQGSRLFIDAGTQIAQCAGKLDDAARQLSLREAAEVARRIADARATTMLGAMTVAVVPLAEERVYRGLLMDALVRKYGKSYGLFASAAAFGIAHLGVYEVALWQTLLLGIGFGLAYAEGGIVASFAVHALWNLLQLA